MLDTVLIVAYFAGLLTVGWFSRKHTAESYWVADRKFGTTRVTFSLIATILGASSTIGIISLGYSQGLTGAWWLLAGAVMLIPFGFWLAVRVRRLAVYTLPDILRKAYGDRVAVPAGLMIVVAWSGIVAAQIFAAETIIAEVFSLSRPVSIALVTGVFVIYTFLGGQVSVIRTDFYQLIFFIGGLVVVMLYLLLGKAPEITYTVPSEFYRFPVSENFDWYMAFIYFPLIVGLPYLVGPDIYSRMLSARDGKVARKAALTAAAVMIPLAFVFVIVGILLKTRYDNVIGEQALVMAINDLLPLGLKGLIYVGLLGAIMSSADSCLVSAGTILSRNVLAPLFRLKKKSQFVLSRIGVVLVGLVALVIAYTGEGIIPLLLMAYSVYVGGVVLPGLASFYKDRLRISSTAAFWAVIIGGTAAVLGKIQDGAAIKFILGKDGQDILQTLLGSQYTAIMPLILSLITLFVLSLIFRAMET